MFYFLFSKDERRVSSSSRFQYLSSQRYSISFQNFIFISEYFLQITFMFQKVHFYPEPDTDFKNEDAELRRTFHCTRFDPSNLQIKMF